MNHGILLAACLFLLCGCRPTGPFLVDLVLVPISFPPGVTCPSMTNTVSGLECVDLDGRCALARRVDNLSVRLEFISMPDEALGARVPEFSTEFCQPGATPSCAVVEVDASDPVDCGGAPASTCVNQVYGSLDGLTDSLVGQRVVELSGTGSFRLLLVDESRGCSRRDPACILGCAYTLPVLVGRGPLQATIALDTTGACTSGALRVCALYAGLPTP